ncbi:glycosyltransferase [Spirilliplanes yamanashiensis]|uniref:Sugar transferase n=1 Tax=Spirilliplanes yamanashiensis TaxID=42233 RepID=A0A8J3Y6W3_9ACTN|nr:glycosyltransferase [Spirilliplanes yamanashiensis]MDP9814756.1 glycosyltransferase involved in cell wall biosynthesis [Spirilliplanes yamanashiensis]GIJ02410.1 sugar transferase [Spirilliplanes yamanashiensis]
MSQPPARVLVVGSGFRFTSGISYYTCRVANALSGRAGTSVLLMRRLIPRFLYPGRRRVGTTVHELRYDPAVTVHDGVDWYWLPSLVRALRFVRRQAPELVVLQWWTAAVLHSYLVLAWYARRRGARVVIEWHEVQDTGEARVPGVQRYARALVGRLIRLADGHVIHSEFDRRLLEQNYPLDGARHVVVPHGPYDHHAAAPAERGDDAFHLLYFGVIRPYKGLEDLVAAFDSLTDEQAAGLRLTIVGETWEGWHAPLQAVAASRHRDRITVVNRYVADAEVAGFFAAADAVVLPYRRSSSSGPLHIAMSAGLPVIVSDVGGLREAADGYAGALHVPPADPAALAAAITRVTALRGERYADVRSWDDVVDGYLSLAGGAERVPA